MNKRKKSALEHVNGVLAMGALVVFWAREADGGTGLVSVLAHQTELETMGLCALLVLALLYVGTQLRDVLDYVIDLIERHRHGPPGHL